MGGLAPSIIAADFSRLAEELGKAEPFAVRWHVDVMDGHFVPNLTIGPLVVEAIGQASALPQDVHMMVSNPDETWEWYRKAGAARITFHADASDDPRGLLERIRDAGLGGGLAVNPDVGAEVFKPYLDAVDHLVVMSVFPGFSGQKFIPEVLPKLTLLRGWVDERGGGVELVIDGGVGPATASACVEAGADLLVSASAIFGSDDPASAAAELAGIAGRAPERKGL